MFTVKEQDLSVEEIRKLWNEWADRFPGALESSARPADPALIKGIIPDVIGKLSLTAADSLLDAGCGSGFMLSEIVKRVPLKATGTDIAENQIRNALSLFPEIPFLAAPIEELPFPGGSFSKILCYSTLSYALDWKKAVNEVLRVCKPGGKILFADLPLRNLRFYFYFSVLSSVPAVLLNWKRLRRAVTWKTQDCPWRWTDMAALKNYLEERGHSVQVMRQPENKQYGCVTHRFRRDILIEKAKS